MLACPSCHIFLDPVSWLKNEKGHGFAEFVCERCKIRMTYTIECLDDGDDRDA